MDTIRRPPRTLIHHLVMTTNRGRPSPIPRPCMAIRPLRLTSTETTRPRKAITVIIHPRETTHLLTARVANIRLTALSS